jgi:ATP synthase protein I
MPSKDSGDKTEGSAARQYATASELPFLIVSGTVVGGFAGYLLDRWLHTKPWLLVILGFVGFFIGVRDVLRRVGQKDSDSSS